MICPRCNTRHQLGAERCQNCGTPFTHRAARRGGPPPPSYNAPPTGREPYPPSLQQAVPHGGYQEREPRQHRRPPRTYRRAAGPGNRAIGGLFALLIITIVIIAGAAILGSGDTASSISQGISDRAGQAIGWSGNNDDGDAPVDVPETPDEPAGDRTWVLTQDELNQRLANRSDSFGPAEDVRVELSEGTVTVKFRAYGVNGTYHGSLTTRDGVPVVADSTIDGPLGWVVSSSEIDDVLNQEMAAVAAEQQVSVESVHVRPGQVVFGIT